MSTRAMPAAPLPCRRATTTLRTAATPPQVARPHLTALRVPSRGVVDLEYREQPGRSYGPGTPWQRHDDARHPSSDTAIEGSDPEARPALWAEPQDRHEMAQAGLCDGCADGAEGA